jgi:hypothetical protein
VLFLSLPKLPFTAVFRSLVRHNSSLTSSRCNEFPGLLTIQKAAGSQRLPDSARETKKADARRGMVRPATSSDGRRDMLPPLKVPGPGLQFRVPPESIEALERLRNSYTELLAHEALMEVDQAVLMVVELTLQQVKNSHAL